MSFVGSPKSIVPQESRKLKTTQIGALKLGSWGNKIKEHSADVYCNRAPSAWITGEQKSITSLWNAFYLGHGDTVAIEENICKMSITRKFIKNAIWQLQLFSWIFVTTCPSQKCIGTLPCHHTVFVVQEGYLIFCNKKFNTKTTFKKWQWCVSVLNWTLLITYHGLLYVSILWCDLMVDDDYVLRGFCGFNIHAEYSWQKRAQQAWKYMLTNIERWRGEVWVHVVDKCKWLEVPSLSMSFQIISTFSAWI